MPIMNYTTSIEAIKTVGEIQAVLMRHGARKITTEYDGDYVSALSFTVQIKRGDQANEISFCLPAIGWKRTGTTDNSRLRGSRIEIWETLGLALCGCLPRSANVRRNERKNN